MTAPHRVVRAAEAQAETHVFWDKLFPVLSDSEELKSSAGQLSLKLKVSDYMSANTVRLLRALGVITYRSHYDNASQSVFFRRLMSLEDGHRALDAHFALGRGVNYYRNKGKNELQGRVVTSNLDPTGHSFKHWRKPDPIVKEAALVAEAITNAPARPDAPAQPVSVNKAGSRHGNYKPRTDETVAIVGPDAESPIAEALRPARREISEPAALIEAARQYIDRERAVVSKISELESLGISIDHEKLKDAIQLDRDPVLEQVSLLLPEWDAMVKRTERLGRENAEWRDEMTKLRREVAEAKDESRKARDANQRLSERNVKLSGELAQRPAQQTNA